MESHNLCLQPVEPSIRAISSLALVSASTPIRAGIILHLALQLCIYLSLDWKPLKGRDLFVLLTFPPLHDVWLQTPHSEAV